MRQLKDSGVEWIGGIPQEWGVSKIKFVADFEPACDFRNISSEDRIAYAPMECIKQGFYEGRDTLYEEVSHSLTPFQNGDIVMAKVTPCFENGNIAIMDGLPSGIGLGSSELFVFRAKTILAKYLFYWLQNSDFIQRACSTMTGAGGLKRVSPFFCKNCDIHVPPYSEQRRIADYLDRKCSQIDAIIARQQEVIERLKAYKLSIITEAVTKGLNSDMPMKDSGDSFIGVMPEHWNVAKLGMLFRFMGGYAYNSDSYTSESDNQVIRIGNVKSGYMALENNPVYISDEIASATDRFRINPGSILFTMTGTKGKRDYFFTHFVTEEDCKGKKLFLNQRVGCFIPKESIDAGYYNYLLKENRILDAIFVYETGTANQGNLGIESIRRTKVQLPSKDEQVKIREYLDNRCAKIEGLLTRKSEIICRLMAYKKALIYEVVTGKREV